MGNQNKAEIEDHAKLDAEYEQQAKARRDAERYRLEQYARDSGRYSLEEAAALLAQHTGEPLSTMQDMLERAAFERKFSVYKPGSIVRYEYPHHPGSNVCGFVGHGLEAKHAELSGILDTRWSEEAYWDDLNAWLNTFEPRITWPFPDPGAPDAAVDAARGITKGAVINAFNEIHFDRDQWKKYLASPPKWLEECRVAKGNKKTSATWNPVLIAAALCDRKIPISKLNAVFISLPDWADEWKEVSTSVR